MIRNLKFYKLKQSGGRATHEVRTCEDHVMKTSDQNSNMKYPLILVIKGNN